MTITYRNFRVRGIPYEHQSRLDVLGLVKSVLAIELGVTVTVHSLAINPEDPRTKVATITFDTIPNSLCNGEHDEWVFEIPSGDAPDDLNTRRSLVFDTHFSGFTPLQETNDCNIDVIVVSGLGGHALGSFKQRGGSFIWLRDALPHDVPQARILIYGYDTRLVRSGSFQNLADLGRAFQVDIKGIWTSSQPRPVIFIGHSLGGLVIKQAIAKAKEEGDPDDELLLSCIAGFMFFGVPHLGMAVESLVPLVGNNPNRALLESLGPNSALLQHLDKDFNNALRVKRPTIVAFYETDMSRTAVEIEGKWALLGPLKILVDPASATHASLKKHPVNRNHSEMVKFEHEYDQFYKRAKNALVPLVCEGRRFSSVNAEVRTEGLGQLSEQQKACLQSLEFREQETRYNEIHSATDTCKWLVDNAEYQLWIKKPRSILWIQGHPGTGKSVLMKFAVTMMKRKQPEDITCSFFCHGRGTPLQKTPLGLFRAILNSILAYFPRHFSEFTAKFGEQVNRRGPCEPGRWQWDLDELQRLLSKVLMQGTKDRSVALFIDALDECGEEHAKYLLRYLNKLTEDVNREEARVRICFSSRYYPIIGLDELPRICMEKKNGNGIQLFAQERLKVIKSETKRQQLETEILSKAKGVFQWAALVTDQVVDAHIQGFSIGELRKKLSIIPESLEGLYADILNRASQSEIKQMVKLFQWILFTERPLALQELREALAMDENQLYTTISEFRNHVSWDQNAPEYFMRYVRHISKGLVEFQKRDVWEQHDPSADNWDREAQFIHQSAADHALENFLKQVSHRQHPVPSQIGVGHYEISRCCLRYMAMIEVLDSSQMSHGQLACNFPLALYAVRFLFQHIGKAEQEGILQTDLIQLVDGEQSADLLNKAARLWKILDPDSIHTPHGWPFANATPLHALVALGSKSAFDEYLRRDNIQVNGRDAFGNTPLLLAVREGHQDMALALLQLSSERWAQQQKSSEQAATLGGAVAQENSRWLDIDAQNDEGVTPLTIAMDDNAYKLVYELIEAGVDIGRDKAVVLYAVENGDKKLLERLIERRANLDDVIHLALKGALYHCSEDTLAEKVVLMLKAGAKPGISTEPSERSIDVTMEDVDTSNDNSQKYYNEAIILASTYGQPAVVKLLLSHGATSTCRDERGTFPLLAASANGHEDVVDLLFQLTEGPSMIYMTNHRGDTALQAAVGHGHAAVVRQLLAKGATLTDTYLDIDTLLRWAAKEDVQSMIKLLAGVRGSTQSTNVEIQHLFSWVTENSDETLTEFMVRRGFNLDFTDEEGRTPLSMAAMENSEDAIELLIENGADRESRDTLGRTPLSIAAMFNSEDAIKLLIKNGADRESRDNLGQTPLSIAAMENSEDAIKLLIKNGADRESRDNLGQTPLSIAAMENSEDAIKLLIKNGADRESRDNQDQTPLSIAAMENSEDAIELLIENGADRESRDTLGRTPLSIAAMFNSEDAIKLLIKNGADRESRDNQGRTPLSMAAIRNSNAIKLLIENGADRESQDKLGRTPLSIAAIYNSNAIELLIENGADIESRDKLGQTPLSIAAIKNSKDAIKVLIENSANIESRDNQGQTPLSLAAMSNSKEIIELLIENGAEKESRDNNGQTPLLTATLHNAKDAIELLIENGADIESKDDKGETPLSLAKACRLATIVSFLLKEGAEDYNMDLDT